MLRSSRISTAEKRSSLSSTITKFDKGPKVTLHIEHDNGAILASRLSLSAVFSCTNAPQSIIDWLTLYSQGKAPLFPLTFTGTPFQQNALEALQQIPFGQTLAYGQLATLCGHPRAARAIGNVCHDNRYHLLIPCHRVLQANGSLGGFAIDLEIKKRLLNFEADH